MPTTPLFSFRAQAELLENPDGLRLRYELGTPAETGLVDLNAEEATEVAALWERLITVMAAARDRAARDDSSAEANERHDDHVAPRFTDPFALRPEPQGLPTRTPMPEQWTTGRRCHHCRSVINDDYWSVCVHREQQDASGISVLFAEEALVACMGCVPTYSRAQLLSLAVARVARK